MKPNWTKYYYDILDFYFWEPQHLGKIKNPKGKHKTYSEVFSHLEKMEVVLNHQLALFFNIIPEEILNSILAGIIKSKKKGRYIYESDATTKIIEKLNDFTQPDFLFEGKDSLLAIEVKLDSTSSLDQFMKYLFLYVLIKKKIKTIKKFHLIFLAKDEFKSIWKQKFKDKNELLGAFRKYKIPVKTAKGGISIKPYKEEIINAIKEAEIHFINFQNLSHFLDGEKSKLKGNKLELGWVKFIEGLQAELKNRKLIN